MRETLGIFRNARHKMSEYRKIGLHRNNVIINLVFIFGFISDIVYSQIPNGYPEFTVAEPEVLYEPAGTFVKLKCMVPACHGRNNFVWEYKDCGPDIDKLKCHNNGNVDWIHLNEKTQHCNSTWVIKNATSKNSGLYRCSKISVISEDEIPIKIYEVLIIDPMNLTNGVKPTFIEVEQENTIIEGSKIVIQCKVYSNSEIPPLIRWLKQIDTPQTSDVGFRIELKNKTYLNMNASQKDLDNDIYISKLIIENSNENDSGTYTCVAVNTFGTSDLDVYINVISLVKEWQGTTSFSKLFLIPIGFGLIPATAWLCIYYYRKRKAGKENLEVRMDPELFKYEPVHVTNRERSFRNQRIYNI